MKLRTWLLLSYLIVMILPLVAAYLLMVWIQSYHDEEKVAEFINTSNQLEMIKNILDEPALYQTKASRESVEQLVSDQLSVYLYNPDGLVLYTSNQALAHSALSKKELFEDLYALNQGYRTYRYKQPVFDEQKIVGFFEVQVARQGWLTAVSDRSTAVIAIFSSIFLLIYVTVIFLVNRKFNKRLTGLMDEMAVFARGEITEEKQTKHDEIGKLQSRFYQMRKQITNARKRIEEEQREKEYMIATLSHDLKTPLTSIKAYAESLEEKNISESEQREYKKVIIDKSDFMKQMLDDLLTYTLLQSPTYEMELVSVEGCEFFDMLMSDYDALCERKGLTLLTHIDVEGMYDVNPKQMMRVMDNLMNNAIHHTPKGGRIGIAAISRVEGAPDWLFDFIDDQFQFQFDENVYLTVQNDGNGMSKENVERVFEPLYQADQARRKRHDHGTGLGLSITKQIITRHFGDVQMLSQEGMGTCVICSMPKSRRDKEAHETII